MDEAGDIAGISIPFTLGIAAGAVAGDCSLQIRILICSAAAVLLLSLIYFAMLKKCSRVILSLIFAAAGILCSFSHPMIVRTGGDGTVSTLAAGALTRLKEVIRSIGFAHNDTGALLCALLTGDRSALSEADIAAFRGAGASHILALSGLHLGVIYMIVSRLLSVMGNSPLMRRLRGAVIILSAGFYTLMTGAGPSIVRAFLFITLNEICRLFPDREHSPARVLLIALTVQLALDPGVIASVGFQLSYLAMTGIIVLFPRLDAWYPEGRGPVRKIWQSTALTVSCQAFTAPLAWIRFHTFPKYFILTNLLALPFTSAIMTLAVVCIILSALSACPQALVCAVDTLVQAMLFCLRVIAGM